MKIDVILERAGSNWSAYAPDLDDVVVATGDTRKEAVNNFRDALRGLIQHKHHEGLTTPDITELKIRETVAA
jgi:predicted RNase H-like HicB family nuclease